MADKGVADGKFLFVVTTQSDHPKESAHWHRVSEIRSHLARRDHAHRREQKKLSRRSPLQHDQSSRILAPRARLDSMSRTVSAPIQPSAPPAKPIPNRSISDNEFDALDYDDVDQAVSLDDLLDIFQPSDPSYARVELPTDNSGGTTDSVPAARCLQGVHDKNNPSLSTPSVAYNAAEVPVLSVDSLTLAEFTPSSKHPVELYGNTRTSNQSREIMKRPLGSGIAEITSTLDPFVQLPAEITVQEKSLIHFYLLIGRQSLLGTTEVARCCPALEIARNIMQICPIHTLSHVVVAEAILSKMTRRPVRDIYFRRYAQLYRSLNTLLSDPTAGVYRKLWAILQVSMVEHVCQRFDLQLIHTAAIDDFIDSQGGMVDCKYDADDDGFAQLVSRLYIGPMARSDILTSDRRRFRSSKGRFLQMMKKIWTWKSQTQKHDINDFEEEVPCEHSTSNALCDLGDISDYLSDLINITDPHDTNDIIQNYNVALICSLALILTFIECQLPRVAARRFLCVVQSCLCDSAELPREGMHRLEKIHSCVVLYTIGYIRHQVFPDNGYSRAFRISRNLLDCQKILRILSQGLKVSLVRWMVESVLHVSQVRDNDDDSDENQVGSLNFTPLRIQALELEIDDAWRCNRTSMKA